MAKKKLILNEGVTRRFMKLAAVKPVYVSNFLTEAEEEEEMMDDEEAPVDDMPPEGDDMAMEEPPMDAEMEPEMEEPAEAGGEEGMIEDFIMNAIKPWAEEKGVSMEVEGAEAPEEELEAEPEAEDMAMDADLEGGDTEMPDEEPEELGDEEELEANKGMYEGVAKDLAAAGVTLIDEKKIIAEVTRRVARRLLRESAKSKKK